MKVDVLQIHWHEKRPIYSVDFSPVKKDTFVTCGEDKKARIWKIDASECVFLGKKPKVVFVQTLERHTSPVNCSKFSLDGKYICTSSDGGVLVLWEEDKESRWVDKKIVYVPNMADIYDLCWSPDSKYVLVGLVNNTVQIWDIFKREMVEYFSDHNHFVNGVAWDPLGQVYCNTKQ